MNPFFFSESSSPLYGVVHEPVSGPYRESAVLFCNPIGHEYFRSYRMMQQLAMKLAEQGFYCLRFDYSGTGDSKGEFHQFDATAWTKDIEVAAEELRALSGAHEIVCIAVRAGGLLALSAETNCQFLEILFWDPVVSGAEFLSDIEALQRAVFSSNWHFPEPRSMQALQKNELLGFIYSQQLLDQLETLSLASLLKDSRADHFCVHTDEHNKIPSLTDMESVHIPDEGDWTELTGIDRSISTHNILLKLVERLG